MTLTKKAITNMHILIILVFNIFPPERVSVRHLACLNRDYRTLKRRILPESIPRAEYVYEQVISERLNIRKRR